MFESNRLQIITEKYTLAHATARPVLSHCTRATPRTEPLLAASGGVAAALPRPCSANGTYSIVAVACTRSLDGRDNDVAKRIDDATKGGGRAYALLGELKR